MKKEAKTALTDIAFVLIGGAIYSAGINVFTAPNNIAPGGATGISTIINSFTGFPIGVAVILINIPLFIATWLKKQPKLLIKTIFATIISSVFVDLGAFVFPAYTEEPLLAAIFGGVVTGIGLGIIFLRGITTGGSDLLAKLIEDAISFLSYAKILMCINIAVVFTAAIAYRDISPALHAAIVIYISSEVVDKILGGFEKAKAVYILSAKVPDISKAILSVMNRGATFIHSSGAYTGENKEMLFIIIKRFELHKLKMLVRELDPSAFIVIGDVSEVLGKGFKPQTGENE